MHTTKKISTRMTLSGIFDHSWLPAPTHHTSGKIRG
jgi:hypothetical protein